LTYYPPFILPKSVANTYPLPCQGFIAKCAKFFSILFLLTLYIILFSSYLSLSLTAYNLSNNCQRNVMPYTLLLSLLLFFSACSTTPEIVPPKDKSTEAKIQSNYSAATNAQDEYKQLQVQRNSE